MTTAPARRTIPRQPSDLERTLDTHLRVAGLPAWETEFIFHPVRRWRFDFCWPALLVAVEIEGGTWTKGRHTRGAGFAGDCLKYNEAALLGWLVLRFTAEQVRDGTALEYISAALRRRGKERQS